MNRAMLLTHLALAERNLAEGYGHVTYQRGIVEKFAREGYEDHANRAAQLLAQFEQLQELYLADRDWILGKLGEKG